MHISFAFVLAAAASIQAANNVAQKVTYTAPGAAAVVGNSFGCAHSKSSFPPTVRKHQIELNNYSVTPAGQGSQLGCVKHVFTNGFTVGVTE